MNIQLPEHVKYIIHTLEAAGYPAYAVGGCVRDSVLGRTPEDWDITTAAHPRQVKALFSRTVDTGIRHGTVTVLLEKEQYEVTTFRIDGTYEDARHPSSVTYTPDLKEDLKRRDFTINAMAYNERDGFVDAFGGLTDLAEKRIRCVGDPRERFSEDALRMLRAVRFAAQLDFSIDRDTREAIVLLAPAIAQVSAERIQTELVKLLVSDHPERLRDVWETGIADVVFPEFSRMMVTEQNTIHHCYTVGEHTIHAVMNMEPDRLLRLAMLFHDIGKPACRTTDADGVDHFKGHPAVGAQMTREILRRMKFDNHTIRRVSRFVEIHEDRPALTEAAVRRSLSRTGPENYPDFFRIKRADILAQSDYMRQDKLSKLEEHIRLYHEILSAHQCLTKKELAVTGNDLIAAGVPRGRQIGEILNGLLEHVLEVPEDNQKEILLELVQDGTVRSQS